MRAGINLKTLLFASGLLTLAVFFGFFGQSEGHGLPSPDNVVPVDDARAVELLHELRDKELEADPFQRRLAAENLNLATDFIIRTLQAMGRKGDINDTGELNVFVNNWRNFTLESQYRAEDLWRGLLDIAANGDEQSDPPTPPLLCDYIRNSEAFKILQPQKVNDLIESRINRRVGTLEEYLVAAQCDSSINENFDTFLGDFNEGGGWDTFERLLQPQNNIYGAIKLAMDELGRQRQIEEQSDLQEANSGSGYLGRRQCLASGSAGQCVIWSNVNIPANLAVETLGALINQNLAFIVTTDEAGEGFGIEINSLIEQIFGPLAPETAPPPGPGPRPNPPPGPPPPEPPPGPQPPPLPGGQPASLLDDVRTERDKYGRPMTDDERGRLLNTVAWNNRVAGWGLSYKDFGRFINSPAGPIAEDILHHQPTNIIVDVLQSSEIPQWSVLGRQTDYRRPWVAPVQP